MAEAKLKASKQRAFEEKWHDRFKDFAGKNDDDAGIAGWSQSGLEARLRGFARVLEKDKPGSFWLDAGCGAGTYSRFLAGRELQVVGCDYSFPTLLKARDRGGDTINWCVSDVKKLPIKPGVFDGVLCFGVTQALLDSERVVAELSSVIKTGGQLWMDALNGWCLPHLWEKFRRRLQGKPMHLRYESPRALKRLMKQNNVGDLRLYWLPILPSRWQRFQWLVETPAIIKLFHAIPLLGVLFSHAFIIRGEKIRET